MFQNEVLASIAGKYSKSQEDMETIATLDTKKSLFFSHNNPEIVKWIGTRKLDI